MSDDFAVDPQASEAGLSEEWREHVRELRAENARRRKENQELRAQLATLASEAEQARAAQAAARERSDRQAERHKAVRRRLKELELGRLTRGTLQEAVYRRTHGAAEGDAAARLVDVDRAQRVLDRMPSPVNLDCEVEVDDDGRVTLEPVAGERLRGFVEDLVEMLSARPQVAPPPVGGEPPRPGAPRPGPIRNAWDRDEHGSPAAQAQASPRPDAAVLEELV